MKSHCAVLVLMMAVPLMAVESPMRQMVVPVRITTEKVSFNGQLTVALGGTLNKARIEWDGAMRNASMRNLFRVTFCLQAFDDTNQPLGRPCILTMWGNQWQSGASLSFKGKQKIKISDDHAPIHAANYMISVIEVFEHAPNLRTMNVRCPLVWASALRVFADKKFRPTVLDKDSLTATYAYDGGRIDTGSSNFLKSYTTAYTGWAMLWESFRVDNASLYLREETPGTCTAEVKMSFAGFGKPLFDKLGQWYAVDSNFNFEKNLMDELEAQSKIAASNDLDKAISQLPTEAPKPVEIVVKPQLTVTSEPSGAEIEIDGEFIGNTPTTVTAKQGKVVVKVTRAGFQPWERSLTLNPGDKRTLNAEMVKDANDVRIVK